ncbi:hypothetical protein [Pantoea sp. AMG 501]|nr:hypothetical protein [Pantoea sp. AMG 501]
MVLAAELITGISEMQHRRKAQSVKAPCIFSAATFTITTLYSSEEG